VALVPDGTLLYSPDSGKPIQKNRATPALVYAGRLYFFCCPTSMQQCQVNPALLRNAKPPNGYDLGKLTGTRQQ
jgi:YHS domain-containing protein